MADEEPRTDFDAWLEDDRTIGTKIAGAVSLVLLCILYIGLMYAMWVMLGSESDIVGLYGVIVLFMVALGVVSTLGWAVWRAFFKGRFKLPSLWKRNDSPAKDFVVVDADAEFAALNQKRKDSIAAHVARLARRYERSFWWADGSAEGMVAVGAGVIAVGAWFASVEGALAFELGSAGGLGSLVFPIMALSGFGLALRLRRSAASKGVMVGHPERPRTLMAAAALLALASLALMLRLLGDPSMPVFTWVVGVSGLALPALGALGGDFALLELAAVNFVASLAAISVPAGAGFAPQSLRLALVLSAVSVAAVVLSRMRNRALVHRVEKDPVGLVTEALTQLDDPRPIRRVVAAATLQRLPDARSIGPLVPLLRDSDAGVARAAALALADLHDLDGKHMPKDLMYRALMTAGYSPGDRVPAEDMNSAHGLACIRWHRFILREFRRVVADSAQERRIVEAADPDGLPSVFNIATLVLSEGRTERGIDHLFSLLTHERASIRARARSILNGSGPYGTRCAVRVTTSDDPRLRRAGASILMHQLLHLQYWRNRAAVIDPVFGSSCEAGDDDWEAEIADVRDMALPVLEGLLDDPDPEARAIAEEGVVRFSMLGDAPEPEV